MKDYELSFGLIWADYSLSDRITISEQRIKSGFSKASPLIVSSSSFARKTPK